NATGGANWERAAQGWLSRHGEAVAKAVDEAPLVPSMAALCADPRARAAPGTGGAPCQLVPPAEEMRSGDTIGSWCRRAVFADWPMTCKALGYGAGAVALGGLYFMCAVATDGLGVSLCLSSLKVAGSVSVVGATTIPLTGDMVNAACVSKMCSTE